MWQEAAAAEFEVTIPVLCAETEGYHAKPQMRIADRYRGRDLNPEL
jgi:hypothetical protein